MPQVQLQEFVEEVAVRVQKEVAVEVPQVQTVEAVRQVPITQYQERVKQVPRVVTEAWGRRPDPKVVTT